MIGRIAKLLALAEAAGTTAEAEAAFSKAQELASKSSIDLEVARQALAPKRRETPVTRVVTVGEKGRHANASLIKLFLEVGRSNDLEVLIAHNSTYVRLFGMPSDIDAAEAIWASLAVAMTRFGDELVRDKGAAWRAETVRVGFDHDRHEPVVKRVTGQSARRSFAEGFIQRIGERLMDARAAAIRDADDHFHNDAAVAGEIPGSTLPSSMALVLRNKKEEVESFMYDDYKKRYGRSRPGSSWRGGGSTTARSVSAGAAGRAAADGVSLGGKRSIAS